MPVNINAPNSAQPTSNRSAQNRFKTSGIVATAVQTNNNNGNNSNKKTKKPSRRFSAIVRSESEDNLRTPLRRQKTRSKGPKDQQQGGGGSNKKQ